VPLLVVHGGAGRGPRGAAREAVRDGLRAALAAGGSALEAGASALDAVVAGVRVLEDHPLFNAGRGSALSQSGEVEMDACVMDSARRAGAVAGVRGLRHPVEAALALLRDGRHVLLAGAGAEAFAAGAGLERADPGWLVTPRRRRQLARWRRGAAGGGRAGGTVGALARDARGGLAAATSTGGLLGKLPGRVSDSALPGAGTWCDEACAVSATGHGESFVRAAFAVRVRFGRALEGLSLDAACARALAEVAALGGSGGCIALDRGGCVALRFDTPSMPRGLWRAGEPARLALGREPLA
jgi:L-asparaginase / beta-aspartyl-peptidase